MHPRAAELIETLGLRPHPEGGYFRETYRSMMRVALPDDRGERAAMTTIHFLLPQGEVSRWHQVGSDEAWHLYEGGPLELLEFADRDRDLTRHVLGVLGPLRHSLAYTIPSGHWQAARPLAGYALLGCSVAPGFEFSDFRLMADEPDVAHLLRTLWPDLADLI